MHRTGTERGRHPERGRIPRAGFTLLEILLVVVIIGIAAGVAVPMFAKSFRGAKLRNSTRTVLMMHRNAQAKAVLGQCYMALLFDQRKSTLEMVTQPQAGEKKDAFFEEGIGGGGSGGTMGAVATGADAPAAGGAAPQALLERKLEEGVRIVSFRGGKELDELYYVNYYPNGMCEAYEVVLGDDENRTARIRVDAVTGRAKVARE